LGCTNRKKGNEQIKRVWPRTSRFGKVSVMSRRKIVTIVNLISALLIITWYDETLTKSNLQDTVQIAEFSFCDANK